MPDDCGGDVVWNIRGDDVTSRHAQVLRVQAQDIALDEMDVGIGLDHVPQDGGQVRVELDRNYVARQQGQITRQAPKAGANLQHALRFLNLSRSRNPFQRERVLQKVLPEALVGLQAMLPEQAAGIERRNLHHGQKATLWFEEEAASSGVESGQEPAWNCAT